MLATIIIFRIISPQYPSPCIIATPGPQLYTEEVALPPMECFKAKAVKVEVPRGKQRTVTVVPRGIGAALKVPPEPIEETDAPLTFAFTTVTPQSAIFPDGYKSLSPIYYIASNKPLSRELEVLLQHNVNVESVEQAGDMIFCHANLPEDGSKEIRFNPIQGGWFEVDGERGSLKTNQLGLLAIVTKAKDTSMISKLWLTTIIIYKLHRALRTDF